MRLEWATLCREPELSEKASLVRRPVAMAKLEGSNTRGALPRYTRVAPKGTRTTSVAVDGKAVLIFAIARRTKKKETIV